MIRSNVGDVVLKPPLRLTSLRQPAFGNQPQRQSQEPAGQQVSKKPSTALRVVRALALTAIVALVGGNVVERIWPGTFPRLDRNTHSQPAPPERKAREDYLPYHDQMGYWQRERVIGHNTAIHRHNWPIILRDAEQQAEADEKMWRLLRSDSALDRANGLRMIRERPREEQAALLVNLVESPFLELRQAAQTSPEALAIWKRLQQLSEG